MKTVTRILGFASVMLLVVGCATLYKKADEYKGQIRSLAVLPLIVGDKNGRVEQHPGLPISCYLHVSRFQPPDSRQVQEFLEYFNGRFWNDFETQIRLINSIELKLPGRDFNVTVHNGLDYFAVARELGVDAVLAINLISYNEVPPGAWDEFICGGRNLMGGYYDIGERSLAGYDTHYSYLDVETVDEFLKFNGAYKTPIEEQRKFFADMLISYFDKSFPLSTDYVAAYKH